MTDESGTVRWCRFAMFVFMLGSEIPDIGLRDTVALSRMYEMPLRVRVHTADMAKHARTYAYTFALWICMFDRFCTMECVFCIECVLLYMCAVSLHC